MIRGQAKTIYSNERLLHFVLNDKLFLMFRSAGVVVYFFAFDYDYENNDEVYIYPHERLWRKVMKWMIMLLLILSLSSCGRVTMREIKPPVAKIVPKQLEKHGQSGKPPRRLVPPARHAQQTHRTVNAQASGPQ